MSASRQATIRQHGVRAGRLQELEQGGWRFGYATGYSGASVSLVLPVRTEPYDFPGFPPFLEGLLPEGPQLEAILRKYKIDRSDSFAQLMAVGGDLVGSLTAVEWPDMEGGDQA